MKKIMFNDAYGLTDAVLQGRKTMMRRIARFDETERPCQKGRDKCLYCQHYDRENGCTWLLYYSPYKVGEVVAVAQSYKDLKLTYIPHIDEPDFKTCTKHAPQWGNPRGMKGWSNKMFVRPDLMPHQIQITDIKVERLQDISDEDCIKEGIEKYWGYRFRTPHGVCIRSNPRDAFAALIDAVSGEGTWRRNPYTYAYNFELVTNLFNFS